MKKVLIVGLSEIVGGTETFLMNYYRKINREHIQFDFLTNKEHIAFEDEIRQLGGKIYKVLSPKAGYIKYKKSIRNFFEIHAKEYLAIWMNTSILINLDYLKYAKKYGIKSRILHSHTSRNFKGPLFGFLHFINKKISVKKYATDYWACATAAGKWFYTEDLLRTDSFCVISNAIDVDKYKYNESIRQLYREQLDLGDAFVLGTVGRLIPLKNHSFMIDILAEILKKRENSCLVLVGDGELFDALKEKANHMGIADKVKLLGSRQDVPQILQTMDVFLLPSEFEGLPLSLLEAQAAGLVCYASDVITDEVKVTSEVNYLSLESGAKKWADTILEKTNNVDRIQLYEEVKQSRFDIIGATRDLEQKFLKMEQRENES
ncbi:glycosyltransferase family 1 protein [Clostridium sp. OM08-29]|nr:glycosyltransferase family 1 protein [Clostridium sp. OM08-29]